MPLWYEPRGSDDSGEEGDFSEPRGAGRGVASPQEGFALRRPVARNLH